MAVQKQEPPDKYMRFGKKVTIRVGMEGKQLPKGDHPAVVVLSLLWKRLDDMALDK